MHSSVHCAMLFSTGYCSIHVYSETHQQGLLVAHYTCNRQSTKQHLRTEQHLRSHIDIQYEEEINSVCVLVTVVFSTSFPGFPRINYYVTMHIHEKVQRIRRPRRYTCIRRQQRCQPGRAECGPGRALVEFVLTGPARPGQGRTEQFLNSLAIRAGSSIL